ncbi:hypothetical conserved protein [Candidatus Nitrosoglobus terrae]|uniref:(5-formylfuran-3-yl)methyl phosphate synthase n=1 Tax=Candidatus Nitrosoglobus terrae TaxID=1630141 RepID=A0A1Q2SJS0_9GAMM|nr:(5-formylfuran-3-yl)methyl phosphate synthase [Candidatus Nitrosoglobus terrae]BAW79374.1 hypothetical conserved protein [Candidatus Nitrosoglobus terrae]
MSYWLASVRSLAEAKWLLESSNIPDILDLKDSEKEALSPLPTSLIRQIVNLTQNRCQVSATIGGLPMNPMLISNTIKEVAATGVNYIKISLFLDDRISNYLAVLQPMTAQGISLVGVVFADQYPLPLFSGIPLIRQAGFKGIMIDTAIKNGYNLLTYFSIKELDNFIKLAHNNGLASGLAGSLQIRDIPILLSLKPDYLGFRSALCYRGQRDSNLSLKAISLLKRMLEDNYT